MSQALELTGKDADAAKRPIVELLALALPTIAQMASYTVMHFIDTLMLSRVGDDAAAAAGIAGMYSFTLISFGFGVLLLVNALVSQSYGKKAYVECGRIMWQGLWWGAAYALMILPLIAFMPRIFVLLGHEPRIVQLENDYFKIVVAASILKLASTAVGDFMLAVNRPNTVSIAAVTGVALNALLAWWLMLASNGPHLGIKGAAWAHVFGMGVELLVLVGYVSTPSIRKPFNVLDWKPRWPEMKALLKLGTPSGLQTVTDVLAWSLFLSWVITGFGEKAAAANTYMFRYMMVSFMPCFGLSAAVTALVGRYIGRGLPGVARQRAHLGFKVAAVYMIGCGLIYHFARGPLIHLFTRDPEVARIGMVLLTFAALYQVFDAMYIIYNGALRGVGDTLIPSIVTGVLVWGVMLFGGYVVARRWPQWGVAGPWTVATLYGAVLGVFMLVRFTTGRWQSVNLEQEKGSDRVGDPEVALPAAQA